MGTCVSYIRRDKVLSNGVVPVWLWISWTNGTLTIGTGNITGDNLILYYPDSLRIANVSTVAVKSFSALTGEWKIPYYQSAGKISCEVNLIVKDILFVFVRSST